MKFEDVITKTILPMAAMAFWFWMVATIIKVSECDNEVIWLFLAGLPYGLHNMRIVLVTKGLDLGGTAGVATLCVIVGGLMGCIKIPYYILRAAYVLIGYIFGLIKRAI